jgi:sialate O-acetylesterase
MLIRTALSCLLALVPFAATADAEVRLPRFLSDHMVLQRDQPVTLWGLAEAGEAVRVSFAGQEKETVADFHGRWRVELDAMPARAEGEKLVVHGASNAITLDDVVVGEVWLCSGQSNMVWRVENAEGADKARAGANDPRIRMFTGANVSTPDAQDDLPGEWVVANFDTVGTFSATAYYFGRELLGELDVPVGLLNVSWGGSSVQAWTSLGTLRGVPAAQRTLEEYAEYAKTLNRPVKQFIGADVDDTEWELVTLPATFKDIGHDIDGVIWFRRQVALPQSLRGRPLTIELGKIDDHDHTYVNGKLVGQTRDWQAVREYSIPAELTESETLTIAIRVRDTGGVGGFHGEGARLQIAAEGLPGDPLPLTGEWRAMVTSTAGELQPQHLPAHLYHGMLHPLISYTVRGAIWYQGENNAIGANAVEYYELFPAFIRDLRAHLGRPELPFVFVQLPNFGENDSTIWNFPIVRDAQLSAFRSLDNVGMAITTDVGDPKDIHPRNKLEVGWRLAQWALVKTYGARNGPATGPIAGEARFDGAKARVPFETYGSELRIRGTELDGFELAGEDRVFHPAAAQIDGASVTVHSTSVPAPKALRYAWRNSPGDANLVNAEGIPASPFRTDDWELP